PLNGGQAVFSTAALGVGLHDVRASYNGDSTDNTSQSADLFQTVNAIATLCNLTSSQNPANVGDLVTFTAVVSQAVVGSAAPTGVVTFIVDGTAQSPATLTGGLASFSASTLGVGSHTVTAVYAGDQLHSSSTSADLT